MAANLRPAFENRSGILIGTLRLFDCWVVKNRAIDAEHGMSWGEYQGYCRKFSLGFSAKLSSLLAPGLR
jgi:hypothetical protein